MMYIVVLCVLLFTFVTCNNITITPDNAKILYMGRVLKTNPLVYYFDWSAVSITMQFSSGTSVYAVFNDQPAASPTSYYGNAILYDVRLNGKFLMILNSTYNRGQKQIFLIAKNLSSTGLYTVKIQRRFEPGYGRSAFMGFVLDATARVHPLARSIRRLEIIGDSITCGWGNLGTAPCTDNATSENALKAWPAMVAEKLGTEYFIEGQSGAGMVHRWDCASQVCPDTAYPSIYNRTLGGSAAPTWNFTQWIPHAFMIVLSTNDFGHSPVPTWAQFASGYVNFVNNYVVRYYGRGVKIFAACYSNGANCGAVSYAATNLTSQGLDVTFLPLNGIPVGKDGIGCDGHPNVTAHTRWANYAAPIIGAKMGWTVSTTTATATSSAATSTTARVTTATSAAAATTTAKATIATSAAAATTTVKATTAQTTTAKATTTQ